MALARRTTAAALLLAALGALPGSAGGSRPAASAPPAEQPRSLERMARPPGDAPSEALRAVRGSRSVQTQPEEPSGLARQRARLADALRVASMGGASGNPSVSQDGRFVAFESSDDSLVPGDTNGVTDVFVRDLRTGVTVRASVSSTGAQANGDSGGPSLSADGRRVAFWSVATNLVPQDTNRAMDVFVRDLETGETIRASTSSFAQQANGRSFDPSISADGRWVAFTSEAANLTSGDTNRAWDIFVKNLDRGLISRVSVSEDGEQANGPSGWPCFSADGNFIAFESLARNLVVSDTNNELDIFVKSLRTGKVVRASLPASGLESDGLSRAPSLSADGRFVAFYSEAENLVSDDGNGRGDVFVKDLRTAEVVRVAAPDEGVGPPTGLYPALSGDGLRLALYVEAPDPTDGSPRGRVFVKDLPAGPLRRIDERTPGVQEEAFAVRPSLSWDGRVLAYQRESEGLATEPKWELTIQEIPPRAVQDFNGDGRSDILWRHRELGLNTLWMMDGFQFVGGGDLAQVPDPNWIVAGIGDANGDGKSDIYWYHQTTGGNALWLMDGIGFAGGDFIQAVGDLNWRPVGVGDFDGDGRSDVLWRNPVTGENNLWIMRGLTLAEGLVLPSEPDPRWIVAGVGDFDRDGKADILWRHVASGANVLWLMEGGTVKEGRAIVQVPDTAWMVAGLGDADGDGRADIFWRHAITGENALWLMSGFEIVGGAFLPAVPDISWQLSGLGDYDGDGRADVLWRYAVTGDNVIWLMGEGGAARGDSLPVVPPGWDIRLLTRP